MIKYLEPLESGNRCRKWKLVAGSDRAHRRSRVFHGGKREAERALDDFADEVMRTARVDKSKITVAQYEQIWLDKLARSGSVDSQTIDGYRWRLNAVCHVIGDVRLQDLTAPIVDACYADMLAGASKSGRPLSRTYVSDAHIALCLMLDSAVADKLMVDNPAKLATPPKRDTKPKRALSDMEMRLLIAMLPATNACAVAVLLAVTTGLRSSELRGLMWIDVDLQNGVLEVARAARKDGSIKDTKTKAGRRVIPLPLAAMDALKKWRECVPDADYVVCGLDGERYEASAVGRWWRRHRHEYCCDGITLHELRHTYVTSLARAGVHPTMMQELAGHSSSRVAMEIYTHLSLDDKRAAVASLNL